MARVVVAMSGGVDSSVAAALAVEAGHQAFGVTLKLLPGAPTGFGCCGSPRDLDDARRVCEKLGIPHYVLDFDKVFEESVVDSFVEAYVSQRTPNPCVECNRSVKFGALLRLADRNIALVTECRIATDTLLVGLRRLGEPAQIEKTVAGFGDAGRRHGFG